MSNAIAPLDDSSAAEWSRILYAFLAEKERRSGSLRTVQSYSRMLNDFFGRGAKTPDLIEGTDVFAWAYGVGGTGRQKLGEGRLSHWSITGDVHDSHLYSPKADLRTRA